MQKLITNLISKKKGETRESKFDVSKEANYSTADSLSSRDFANEQDLFVFSNSHLFLDHSRSCQTSLIESSNEQAQGS